MSASHLTTVSYVFGVDFIRWVLNFEDAEQPTESALDSNRKEALEALAHFIETHFRPPFGISFQALKPSDFWAQLRAHCGGTIPSATLLPGDELANALLALADLAYPILLMASTRADVGRSSSHIHPPTFFGHEANRSFLTALQKDSLGELFPLGTDDVGMDQSVRLNTPFLQNFCLQRCMFASVLLRQAWLTAAFRGIWDLQSYRQTAVEMLNKIRLAKQRQPVRTSLFFGFTGCALPSVLNHTDFQLRPFQGGPQLGLISADAWPSIRGGTNTWLGFTAEIPVEYFLEVAQPDQNPGRIGTEKVHMLEEKWSADVSLAFALARISEAPLRHHDFQQPLNLPPSAPTNTWRCFVELIDQNGMSWNSRPLSGAIAELTGAELAAARDLLGKIGPATDVTLRIAANRILMGIQQPRHIEDGLLDAVIAWENIAGDTRDAVKLKTCAVLAHLIAHDSSRASVRNELEKIYAARNEIVHGLSTRLTDRQELSQHANRALEVALRALRELLTGDSKWLAVRKRFEHMYLGG